MAISLEEFESQEDPMPTGGPLTFGGPGPMFGSVPEIPKRPEKQLTLEEFEAQEDGPLAFGGPGPMFATRPPVSEIRPPLAEFLKNTPEGKIAGAFGHGFGQPFAHHIGLDDKDFKDMGVDDKTLNELGEWQKKYAFAVRDGLIAPSAKVLDAAFSTMMALIEGPIEGAGAALEDVGGITGAAKEIRFTAYGLLEGYPIGVKSGLGIPHLPKPIAEARANAVIGEGERGYYGLDEPTPAQRAERASAASSLPEMRLPEEPAKPLTVHEIARNMKPELFTEYDALQTQRETTGRWIRELSETRRVEAENSSPFLKQMDALEEGMAGGSARQKKKAQEKIDALRTQHEQYMAEQISKDTPDLERVRAEYNKADYRMRDLAEQVSAANREAQKYVVEEPVKEPPIAVPEKAIEDLGKAPEALSLDPETRMAELERKLDSLPETSPERAPIMEEMAALAEKAIEKYIAPTTHPIISDMTKKLTDAGRPKEEAHAAAQLVKAHYDARSKRFEGKRGTPEEMYARDMADVRQGRERARTLKARELAQRGPISFYSALERAIETMPQGKGSADQWRGIVNNLKNRGVKQEEIEWSGIQDWLKEQEGSVTKEQVMDYLKANQLKVEEVIHSDKTEGSHTVREYNGNYEVVNRDNEVIRTFDNETDAQEWVENNGNEYTVDRTKFSSYVTPGGENYRELLITLPETKVESLESATARVEEIKALMPKMFGLKHGSPERIAIETRLNELRAQNKEAIAQTNKWRKNFRSSHFDEPNVLAHMRFNERTDADGKKTMFIEEVQSDWHQKGRESGYYKERADLPDGFKVEERDGRWHVINTDGDSVSVSTSREQAVNNARPDRFTKTVPDAPFKTTWPELAFKRALMWAVENDFDKVAWTTGEQQAARYDLSKQVDNIRVLRMGESDYSIKAIRGRDIVIDQQITKDKLADAIGKDLAEKADKLGIGGQETYAGGDLKVGGEGMKTFYDKMLPSMVNKLVKKWGGKVEEGKIETDSAVHEGNWVVTPPDGAWQQRFSHRSIAQEWVKNNADGFGLKVDDLKIDNIAKNETSTVHSLEITPEMRESVEGGLPLFQGAKGKIKLAEEDAKAIIKLFKSADASTFIHETGHHWLDELFRDAKDADAPADLKADMATVMKWLELPEGADLRAQKPSGKLLYEKEHEKFARGFERYLMEGVAPSKELAGIFAKFKEWLTKIYQMVEKLKSPINDDIRHVFDRLLSTKKEEVVVAPERVMPEVKMEPGTAPPAVAVGSEAAPPKAEPPKKPEEPAGPTLPPPTSQFMDKAGNIRLENLNTPEDVNVLVREIAEQNEGFMPARGIIPDDMVMAFADAAGIGAWEVDLKELAKKFGHGNLSSMIVGGRKLFIDSATKLRDAMNMAAVGDDAAVMAYAEARARHMMIQEQLSSVTAEAGRALRAFHEIGGAEDAKMLGEFLQQATGRTLNQLKEEAKLGAKLDTPQKVSKFIKDSEKATFMEMMVEFWINSLLSGPRTHVTNILSNTLVAANNIVETGLASGIGKVLGSAERIDAGELKSRVFGMMQGAKDGSISAWKALKDEDFVAGELKVETPRKKAIPGVAGQVVRVPGRLLAAEDQFFKGVAYRAELNGLAHRMATKEGLTGNAFDSRIAELTMNPTEDMMKAANQAANYQTFNKPLGATGQSIMWFANSHPSLRFLMPFIRTPTNIVKYAGERSPLGLFSKQVRNNLMGVNGTVARDTQLARMAWGTTLGVAAFSLALEGKITGGGPADPREMALWRASGKQPYSMKIGNTYYSFARFEPLGMIFGVSADMAEISKAATDAEAEDIAVMALASITKNLTSKTWLRGPSEAIEAITDPERYGEQYVSRFAASFIPTGLGQIAQTNDPIMREARGIIDTVKARIPGMSDDLLPRRDVWGEPITREGALGPDLVSPIFESRIKNDPVNQRLLALGVYPDKPDRKIRSVELTDEQYDEYAKVSGRLAKRRLDTLVRVPGFENMPSFAQEKIIRKTIDDSREAARSLIMMENPEIIQQARDNKLRAIQKP